MALLHSVDVAGPEVSTPPPPVEPPLGPRRLSVVAPVDRRRIRAHDMYRLYAGELEQLMRRRADDGPRLIVTPNLDHLRLLSRSRALRRAYGDADIVLNDSRFLDRAVFRARARCLPGSELAPEILAAAPEGTRFMIVGASPGLERWAQAAFPELAFRFIDPSRGYIGRRGERRDIVGQARAFAPRHIFVCTGAPQSEIMGAQLKRGLGHACDILCCGGALQFMAGEKTRAPRWMRALSIEWLWRFAAEAHTRGRYLADMRFLAVQSGPLLRLRRQASARLPSFGLATPDEFTPRRGS